MKNSRLKKLLESNGVDIANVSAPVKQRKPLSFSIILIVGVIHTGLVYLLYFGSMEHLSAQAVAVLSYIDPVVAIFASWIVLGESITILEFIGAVLIIGSAILSEKTARSYLHDA